MKTLITCLDLTGGRLFGGKRLTADREIRKRIISQYAPVFMDDYSASSFEDEYKSRIVYGADYLNHPEGCFFLEKDGLKNLTFDRLIIYRYMRRYPATDRLDISLDNLRLISKKEFKGYSHEKIIEEIYTDVSRK